MLGESDARSGDFGPAEALVDFAPGSFLVVVGRQNADRRSRAFEDLVQILGQRGLAIRRFDLVKRSLVARTKGRLIWFQTGGLSELYYGARWLFRRARAVAYVPLRHLPGRLNELSPEALSVRWRARRLRDFIDALGPEVRVVILAQSAGGRIASRLGPVAAVRAVACFGYPFRNPDHPPEAARVRHLRGITTPFLIVQGRQDEYGGAGSERRYALSHSISFFLVDSDHDYSTLSAVEIQAAYDRVLAHFAAALT